MSDDDREKLLKLRRDADVCTLLHGHGGPCIDGKADEIHADICGAIRVAARRPMTEAEEKLVETAIEAGSRQYIDKDGWLMPEIKAVLSERANPSDLEKLRLANEAYEKAYKDLREATKVVPTILRCK